VKMLKLRNHFPNSPVCLKKAPIYFFLRQDILTCHLQAAFSAVFGCIIHAACGIYKGFLTVLVCHSSVMTYIEELKEAIRKLHMAEPVHFKCVQGEEIFQGKPEWDGAVEVFELSGHPDAKVANAWTHDTDDPKKSRPHIPVLHVPPVDSPEVAGRAAILGEFRYRGESEES